MKDKHTQDLIDLLRFAVKRVELANEEGNPILSAWLPDAKAAIARATTKATGQATGTNTND